MLVSQTIQSILIIQHMDLHHYMNNLQRYTNAHLLDKIKFNPIMEFHKENNVFIILWT